MEKRATALVFYLGLPSQATPYAFQTNPTIAAGDVRVSKDGGALANIASLPTVAPAGGKMVQVSLSSTEMDADNVTLVFSDASGAEWVDTIVNIPTYVAVDANVVQITDAAGVRTALGMASANLDTQIAALPTAAENAASVRDVAVDGTVTLAQSLRLVNAALGGKVSGADTTNETFRDLADTKNRIVNTVDASGNRTVVTLDLS